MKRKSGAIVGGTGHRAENSSRGKKRVRRQNWEIRPYSRCVSKYGPGEMCSYSANFKNFWPCISRASGRPYGPNGNLSFPENRTLWTLEDGNSSVGSFFDGNWRNSSVALTSPESN